MDFEDDIRLGDYSPTELDDEPLGSRHADLSDSNRFNLTTGLIVSVLLHLLLITIFIRVTSGIEVPPDRSTPTVVQIKLLPPLEADIEVESEQAQAEEELADIEEPVEDILEEIAEEELIAEAQVIEELPADTEPEPPALPTPDEPLESLEREQAPLSPVLIPSVAAVRQTLEAMQSEQSSRFYSYDCNKLEEEEGLRECEPTNDLDYAAVERNPVYEFHNPQRPRSRTRETSGVLYSETTNIGAQLAASGLPAGLSDYVMEELEAGVSVYSNTGNRAVQQLDYMVDRSEAAVMAERMFDPWVQNQTRLLKERRYYSRLYSRQAREAESNCTTAKIFTLQAQEFATCILMDTGPSLLLKFMGL